MKKGQRARQFNMMLIVMLFLLFTFGSQLEARVVPKIDCKKITLIQGKKKRLKVSGISAKKVRWVSKNNSIATVSRNALQGWRCARPCRRRPAQSGAQRAPRARAAAAAEESPPRQARPAPAERARGYRSSRVRSWPRPRQ